MQNTITIPGWQGQLGRELAPRELEATLYVMAAMSIKQIAKAMSISPATVTKRLVDARDKLGHQPNLRGLAAEAMRRGIVAPLAIILMLGAAQHQQATIVRRPNVPRTYSQLRIARKVDEVSLAA